MLRNLFPLTKRGLLKGEGGKFHGKKTNIRGPLPRRIAKTGGGGTNSVAVGENWVGRFKTRRRLTGRETGCVERNVHVSVRETFATAVHMLYGEREGRGCSRTRRRRKPHRDLCVAVFAKKEDNPILP